MPGALEHFPFVTVVVPVRNGEAMIGDTIESLLAGDYPEDRREILVVDNGSTDGTAEEIKRHPVRYLHEEQPGVSNARNRGIAEGRGEIYAFIDGDCLADPQWLTELIRPFTEDFEVGCVAGELHHAAASTAAERQSTRMLGRWQQYAVSSNPPYAITANAAYRAEVFDEIGGPFDPRMPRAQDVEMGLRFSERSSRRLVYAENAVVRHRHRSSQIGFFRQQIGWAYGAGLVAAKYHAIDGRPNPPPRLRDIGTQVKGLGLVASLRFRRGAYPPYDPAFLEDAWFNLMRQTAWYAGARTGILRGARLFRDEERVGATARPQPPRRPAA